MKQYLLSIYQPDGDPPPPEVLEPIMRDVDALNAGDQGRRRLGLRRRAAPAEHGHRGAARGRRGAHRPTARTPRARSTSAGSSIIQAPDLDAALDWGRKLARATTLPIEVRPFQDEADDVTSAPCRTSPAAEIERVFREEYGRAVAVLVRVFGDIDVAEEAVQDAFTAAVQRWPSTGLPPSPAGWIITTARNRAIDRLRREASRDDRHAQAALLHAARRTGRGGSRARRPAAPDLHLLPPGARPRRPGRADAAAARRAHHRGDRARLPGARADHGAAAGPGQGQDPRRADPVPGPAARPTSRTASGPCWPSST